MVEEAAEAAEEAEAEAEEAEEAEMGGARAPSIKGSCLLLLLRAGRWQWW